MTTVAAGVGAAVFWGVADFAGGIASRRMHAGAVAFATHATGLVAIAVLACTLGLSPVGGEALVLAACAGVCSAVGAACLFGALARGPMSLVSPLSSTFILIPLAAGFAGGEALGAGTAAGLALVFCGATMAAARRGNDTVGSAITSHTLLLTAGAAILVGLLQVLLDRAGEGGGLLTILLLVRLIDVALLGILVGAFRLWTGPDRDQTRLLVWCGVNEAAGLALFTVAVSAGSVAVASVLTTAYSVVTAGLARWVLAERLRAHQLAGVTLTVMGVAILAGMGA